MIEVDYITKAQSGDNQAFKFIFTSYRQKVYRTAFLILRDYQQAEDVVQDTFMQVYLKLNKLSNPIAFEKWLYRITMNSCMEVMRNRKKNSLETSEEDLDVDSEKMDVGFNLPENKLIQKEQQMNIMECISKLSIRHRTVLILYYYNDFDVKEIAEITGSTEGTVKSRLFYGRKLLKEVLKAEGFDTEDDTEGGKATAIQTLENFRKQYILFLTSVVIALGDAFIEILFNGRVCQSYWKNNKDIKKLG